MFPINNWVKGVELLILLVAFWFFAAVVYCDLMLEELASNRQDACSTVIWEDDDFTCDLI